MNQCSGCYHHSFLGNPRYTERCFGTYFPRLDAQWRQCSGKPPPRTGWSCISAGWTIFFRVQSPQEKQVGVRPRWPWDQTPRCLLQSASWHKHLVSPPGNSHIAARLQPGYFPSTPRPDWSDQYFRVPATRGVASSNTEAPPENDPKVLNALGLLTLDGQEQVSQAAASTVEV